MKVIFKFLHFIALLTSVLLVNNVFANGGAGGDVVLGGAGGVDSVSGTGGAGAPGLVNGSGGNGGGGGGAGLGGGGTGGSGTGGSGAGGSGGTSGVFPNGGLTNTNILGSTGGSGGASTNGSGAGGGGGGAGGYGIIMTNQSALTNIAAISVSGGAGGIGGIGSYAGFMLGLGGGGGGSGGIGIYIGSPNVVMNNYGAITGGAGGAGGAGSRANGNRGGGSGGAAVEVATGSSVAITNSGNLTGGAGGSGGGGSAGAAGAGILIDVGGSTSAITNTGTITGGTGSFGIWNNGTISSLSNSQTNLTYTGILPTNYNIIINRSTQYGQLSGTSVTGSTAFGIYAGSAVTSKLYTGVLQGLTTSNVGATRTGTYSGLSWSLGLESGSASIWDLTFTGGSTADTQSSLAASASALQGAYTLQNTVLVNGFTYDCPLFDTNGVCISAGGRNTSVSANSINNTSGLLIGAYRVNGNIRVGAYVDQNLSSNTVNGIAKLDNGTPALGLFGVWSEKMDGTGAEVKVSAGYGQKNTTVTRQVVGTSEAGSGSSNLMSQGAQAIGKYGFAVMDKTIVSPYAGIRYTQNNMGRYTEGSSSAVTTPLTYTALNTSATTALAGVGASYKVVPTVTTLASAGVETDISTNNGTYTATGITGLTPINFNPSPVRTRPTAMLGAYYDIEKNQRLGLNAIYRQEAYQGVSSTTVMATYTVGL